MVPSFEQIPKSGLRFVFVQHGWSRVITAKKSLKNVQDGACAWEVYYVTPSGQVLMGTGEEDVRDRKNPSGLNFDPTVSSMNLLPPSDYHAPPSLTHAQLESTRARLRSQVLDDAYEVYLALHFRSPALYTDFGSWCVCFDWDRFLVTDDGRIYLESLTRNQLEHLAQEFAVQDARIIYEWRCSVRKQDSSRIVRVIQDLEPMNPCDDLELGQESSSSTEIIGSQSSSTIIEHESTDGSNVSPRTDQQQLSTDEDQLSDQKTIDQEEERPPIDVPAESERAKRARLRQEARERKLKVGQKRAKEYRSRRDARETSEERQERLEKKRIRYRNNRAKETGEQRARRLESKRASAARTRERRRLEALEKKKLQ